MNTAELQQLAYELGFSAAEVLNTEELPFRPQFRVCCEDNSCGMYGVNHACPPACGTTEEMERKVRSRKKALFLQTIWEIEDLSDKPTVKVLKGRHNALIRKLVEQLPEKSPDSFMIAASGCSVCKTCTLPEGLPCRYPELQTSCVSAYCIYVSELCEKLGWDYDLGPGLVAFFGMYVYD